MGELSRRRVGVVILCEDKQQEVFCRKFLEDVGWNLRQLRVEIAPRGIGSAKQYVSKRYPNELTEYRSKRNNVNSKLIVMIDGDAVGVSESTRALDEYCRRVSVNPRSDCEAVAILVPTWNIETWLTYLDGQAVDESRRNYPRLDKPGLCRRHAKALAGMCQSKELRNPAPHSLQLACDEYQSRITENT